MSLADQYRRQFAWRDWETALSKCPVASGQSVLDLGCGTGDLARELGKRGAKVTAIDNNAELLAVARADNPYECKFVEADLGSIRSLEQRFDGLWSSFVPAYFTDFEKTLKGWLPLLKGDSWVCLTEIDDLLGHEPLSNSSRTRVLEFYEEALAAKRYDFRMGKRLKPILEAAGFEVEAFTLRDKELSVDGPATSEVLQAWSDRLARMGGLKNFLGAEFRPFCDEFLSTLSSKDHRSLSQVVCCVGRRK